MFQVIGAYPEKSLEAFLHDKSQATMQAYVKIAQVFNI